MEKNFIYRYFAKLYFLRLAEEKKISIAYFANYRKNTVYEDYFQIVKKLKFIGEKGIADNELQRRRVFDLFKHAVRTLLDHINLQYTKHTHIDPHK